MHNAPSILVTTDMEHLPAARALLEAGARVTYAANLSRTELLKCIGGHDAVLTNLRQRVDREIMDAGTRLRVLATPSTGTDHIDVVYAQEKGIEVQSLKNDYDLLRTVSSTAEHAFLLMLACLRRLPFAFDDVKAGNWDAAGWRGREAAGRTVGIVGYGRLGEMFSRMAHAFSMRVLACDPFKTIRDAWVEQLSMDALLSRAEIVTLHVHLAPETRGLLGAAQFAMMRDGVYLVNTSRGAVMDEAEFLRALKIGKIACAGIDVLADELENKTGDNPLVRHARAHRNLIITPHIGGCTLEAQDNTFRFAVRKLLDRLQRA